MVPTRPTPIALLLFVSLPACRPQADTATAPPQTPALESPATPTEDPPDTGADAPAPEDASADTEVIEIGVADVGAAATITAAPERPAMPSMMSDISMAPSR